jgi:hypothetical protein
MAMKELIQLVREYVAADDYPAFRRAFVVRFLSTQNTDTALEAAVNVIESECADFSEGRISADELKRRIVRSVQPQPTTVATGIVISVSEFDTQILQPALPGCPRKPLALAASSGTFSDYEPPSSKLSNFPNMVETDLEFAEA